MIDVIKSLQSAWFPGSASHLHRFPQILVFKLDQELLAALATVKETSFNGVKDLFREEYLYSSI